MITPLSLANPLSTNKRIAELERIVREQGERIAALEARLDGGSSAVRQADALRQHNLEQQAEGARRRAAVRQLLEKDRGPSKGAGKRIWGALAKTDIGCTEQLSLRAVQHHITQIRKAASVAS